VCVGARGPSTTQVLAIGGQALVPLRMTESLWSGSGYFGEDFVLFFFLGLAAQVVLGQAIAEEGESVFGGIDELEQVQVFGSDCAGVDEGLEVHDAVPVFAAVDYDENLFGQLVGLSEGEDFEEFVDGAEAAGKNHQRFGEIGEPELAHEEIVELEVERGRDVRIGILLEREIDVEADGFASGFVGAEVGGFHDAGTTAGGNDEAAAAGGNLNGPFCKKKSEAARVLVVTSHVDGCEGLLQVLFLLRGGSFGVVLFHGGQVLPGGGSSLEAGRAEEYDGVLDLLAAKAGERLLILGEDAENASVWTAEEWFVLVGQRRGIEFIGHLGTHVLTSGWPWHWPPARLTALLVFVVVEGFPKADPDVE
jgi:hypothetical protein